MVDQRCSRRWYLAARVTSLPPTVDTWERPRPLEISEQVWSREGRRRLRLERVGVANRLDSCVAAYAACATFSIEFAELHAGGELV
jgi:hypothetical protein